MSISSLHFSGNCVTFASARPDRAVAAGRIASTVLANGMPEDIRQWEDERLEAMQMKADVERLKFKLSVAESEFHASA